MALGRKLEKVKRGDEAREAYDRADEYAVGRAYELIAHARSVVERAAAYMELCRALKAIKRDSEALEPCDKASELSEDAAEIGR